MADQMILVQSASTGILHRFVCVDIDVPCVPLSQNRLQFADAWHSVRVGDVPTHPLQIITECRWIGRKPGVAFLCAGGYLVFSNAATSPSTKWNRGRTERGDYGHRRTFHASLRLRRHAACPTGRSDRAANDRFTTQSISISIQPSIVASVLRRRQLCCKPFGHSLPAPTAATRSDGPTDAILAVISHGADGLSSPGFGIFQSALGSRTTPIWPTWQC